MILTLFIIFQFYLFATYQNCEVVVEFVSYLDLVLENNYINGKL